MATINDIIAFVCWTLAFILGFIGGYMITYDGKAFSSLFTTVLFSIYCFLYVLICIIYGSFWVGIINGDIT